MVYMPGARIETRLTWEIHIVKKVLIVLVLGFSLAHAGFGLEPSLFFDQQVPVVSATTPGGEVALIGVGRDAKRLRDLCPLCGGLAGALGRQCLAAHGGGRWSVRCRSDESTADSA